jgi:hypothetical protein
MHTTVDNSRRTRPTRWAINFIRRWFAAEVVEPYRIEAYRMTLLTPAF